MAFTRWLYFRLYGLVALIAVGAYWWQYEGLAGPNGVWPRELQGADPLLHWPVHALCAIACVASLLLIAGLAPRAALLALWASWLSVTEGGGPFLWFQWDMLLVESAFLSIPFAPAGIHPDWKTEPSSWSRWILHFLAFKLTFSSGVVKLASGDPTWRDFTALTFHYWTQPLPTWTSYGLNLLPVWIHRLACVVMFVLELPAAALAIVPHPLARRISGVAMILLQLGLFVAGNYSYFNVLSIALALPLLDDALLQRLFKRTPVWPTTQPKPFIPGAVLAGLIAIAGVLAFFDRGNALLAPIRRFNTINAYGAFAVMTKTRPEITVEGSHDGVTWQPYEFKWKPGRLDVRPDFIAPWQPRLDWQMWFAALGDCRNNPWVLSLQRALMLGTPEVLALMGEHPFKDRPPKFTRTLLYQYRFAPPSQPGVWWSRTLEGGYCPQLTLDPEGRLMPAR